MPVVSRSYAECKHTLETWDANTLQRRIERCQELEIIQTGGRESPGQKEWDYTSEASENYIAGNYRSAIFCCACSVDQIFRYEFMKLPGSDYTRIEKLTLGQVIGKCKQRHIERLLPFISQALLLNSIRNGVATHPLFIDVPVKSDADKELKKSLLTQDIRKLLELVGCIDEGYQREIESTQLVDEIENRTYVLGEVAQGHADCPDTLDGFWSLIENQILRFLANRAWLIVKLISESLYPAV
jgi:hypothetical protein